MRVIYVRVESVYGNRLVYPVCDQSRLLARLAGHKTLTENDLSVIRRLGYDVQHAPLAVAV